MTPPAEKLPTSTEPTGHGERAVAGIVVAAGKGRRFGGGDNKVLYPLDGRPIWSHAVDALRASGRVDEIIVVIRPEDRDAFSELAGQRRARLVDGGQERYDSVRAGLDAIREIDASAGLAAAQRWVAVHDAARPLVPVGDVVQVIEIAVSTGAALLATPIRGTIKRRDSDGHTTTVDRDELWEALTPQVFRFDIISAAYARWRGRPATDDAEMVERSGFPVTLVPGSAENLKITHAEDLTLAQAILSRRR
jgi:2-C-methyl-D-erythritol 4-phosphate cytidylyltransferase